MNKIQIIKFTIYEVFTDGSPLVRVINRTSWITWYDVWQRIRLIYVIPRHFIYLYEWNKKIFNNKS